MTQYRLGEIEAKFAALIWDNEPLTSGRLAELCRETLSWKKSTTYTVLRRLCQRGIVQNDGGVVTSLLSREEFDGSLPKFLTAFTFRKKLSSEEIDQLQQLIDKSRR